MLRPGGPKPWMTWDLLASGGANRSLEVFSGLACPEPLPCKTMELGKWQQPVHLKDMENQRHPALPWRRSGDQILEAKDHGNLALHSVLHRKLFILHVYLTSMWIKAILFHKNRKLGFAYSNIWTRKEESLAQDLAGLKNRNMQWLPCCRWFKTSPVGGIECDCHLAVVWGTSLKGVMASSQIQVDKSPARTGSKVAP